MARKTSRSSSPAPAARSGRRAVPWALVGVVAIASAYVVIADQLRFTQDDAFISLRYARNLVEGHGLVFNEGERVEGYSNFAWTLLLAFATAMGAPPVPTTQVLGIVFGFLTVLVTGRFARALEGRWGVSAMAAAAFVAGNLAFVLWSTGGLETSMFAFLVVLGLERALAPDVGTRGRTAAPLVLALAALTRPEGPLVFALLFAVRVVDLVRGGPAAPPRGRADLVRESALFVAPLVPYALWKLWYFGDLLPNPFYAKTGRSLEHLRLGIAYAGDFFRAYGVWGVAPLTAAASLLRDGRRGLEARLLAIWLGWAVYVVAVGGDVLYLHRFWLHTLPLGAVLLGRGVTEATTRAFRPRAHGGARPIPPRRAATVVALAFTAVLVAFDAWWNLGPTKTRRDQETGFVANMTQIGEWLGEHMPGSTIAITTIGAISYYSRLRVIDMLGLTDHEVAHEPRMIDGITDTWREIQYNAESVLRRRPDAIFFSTGVRPSSAAEKALFFYKWFHQSYYPYYYRSKPWRESIQSLFRLRPDAPPFDPARVSVNGTEWIDLYSEAHIAKSRDRDQVKGWQMFGRSMELSPPEFQWPREWWAVSRYDAGDSTSVETLREIAASDPYATVAKARLAGHSLRMNDLASAERLFQEIVAVDPDDNIPWIGLAEVARARGDLDEAYRCTNEAIRLWDTNPAHLVLHGSLAIRVGDLTIAENAFRRALATGPDEDVRGRAQRGLDLVAAVRSGRVSIEDIRTAMSRDEAGAVPDTP